MVKNISRALTLVAGLECTEIFMHADVSAWGAPSECHHDVSRGEGERAREMRRHVRGITGLRWRAFVRAVRRDYGIEFGSPKWQSLVGRVYEQRGYPF